MGETVTFSCTTSHLFLIWTVTFADRTIGSKTQFFRQTDSLKSLTKLVRGQQLHFQLTSTANGVIESILNVIQASPLMTNAMIKCEGSALRPFKFKFACKLLLLLATLQSHSMLLYYYCTAVPGIPTDIALNNETHYGSMLANVTLTWEGPGGRVDKYNVNVSTPESSTINLSFSVTESRLTLDGVPYNDDIIVTVSTVNCIAESEKVNISFAISKHFNQQLMTAYYCNTNFACYNNCIRWLQFDSFCTSQWKTLQQFKDRDVKWRSCKW